MGRCCPVTPAVAQFMPFTWAWGALNLNNQVNGALWADMAESSANAFPNGSFRIPLPANGGVLQYLSFLFRTTSVAVNTNWIAVVDGADTALNVPVLAGGLTGYLQADVVIPVGVHNLQVRFTAAAVPGAVTTRPAVVIGGLFNK